MTGTHEAATPRFRNFYGRRHGKALRPSQKRLIADLLPRLQIPGIDDRRPVDPVALFGDARPLWLEIGFGGGEHLAHQAALNPGLGLIGCEPYVNGVAMLLNRIERGGIANLRIHPGDARDLIELLPEGSVERVFLLYPDPWPKARHHRRRFLCRENLAMLRRIMRPGSELRFATDIPDYVDHALTEVAGAEGFALVGNGFSDPWPDWPGTRYEAKALAAGRSPAYLTILRT
jgi:tRNA (guanine-N7-)-methyltransferase